jgi:hypothetical protein
MEIEVPGAGGKEVMKRAMVFLAAYCLLLGPASADKLELKKKAGEYEVGISINRNPPVVGDNTLEVKITDAAGNPLEDAKVLVNYYMPPMPRMAPMNYKEQAKFKKGRYVLEMSLIMAGPWIIILKITAGEKTTTAKFNFDAH